jgi:mono/diheme cytochrome c family protein
MTVTPRCLGSLAAVLLLLTIGTAWNFAATAVDPKSLPPAATHTVSFVKEIQPIFATACLSCHDARKQRGDYRLDIKESALAEGRIVPGKSAESPLIHYVAGVHANGAMPPKGPALTARQIGLLRAWIDQGAKWPEVAEGTAATAKHWSLEPLNRPAVPTTSRYQERVKNPIDAFVLTRLEQKGLTPAALADRRTLIRRVTYDLTGLPPSLEEIEAFVKDSAPDAYERVVDRLLASPRYGERWARHWMDVIHFAESHGHDQDVPRENAWPYRDYLIRSLNEDKPYARFVEEQVAGDVLYPDDPEATIALGMIAAGPWDESSQQSIRDDTIDKKIAQTLDRDDMVATVMGTFASATVHCARCHNHKFDPISQADYYALQAVFAGVDRANRPVDIDPAIGRKRRELLALKSRLEGPPETLARLLEEEQTKTLVQAWERGQGGVRATWKLLDPDKISTHDGSKGVKEADGSVSFQGPRPDKDVYTLEAETDLEGITAVRLELLTDDRYPHHGPGRQDNGNLHLSELRLEALPRDRSHSAQPVAIQTARADFNQAGWEVDKAIDGNKTTAWGIYPQVGKSHQAVFALREPIKMKGGARLIVHLDQLHGGGHLIARLRLAITSAAKPVDLVTLPAAIEAVLAIKPEKRTPAQNQELARFVLRGHVETSLAALPAPQMVYAAASDFKPEASFQPAKGCRPIHLLRRGDIKQPLELAQPGSIGCVEGLESRFKLNDIGNEGSRRAALARWLSDRRNVLTWRSIVNRVWHYHFGQGIVATPNDLGHMGARPTHPELLDWLAVEFRDTEQGSLKKLHRLIVTSNTYCQSSRHNADNARSDGDNLLLWRMNMHRLDAEAIHDCVLAITGKLDLTMGGPSIKQFVKGQGIHVTLNVDYQGFDVDNPGMYRRSIYRFLFRTLPDPLMDTLDCPDASQFAPTRASSVTALQALAMLNDRFLVRQSQHLANRLIREKSGLDEQVRLAYLLVLGRAATEKEQQALSKYCTRHGLPNGCRLLLNSNEFLFVP